MTHRYDIRQALPSDAGSLFDLFQSNHFTDPLLTREQFAELFLWQYHQPPHAWHCELVAANERQIVAHYGLVPTLLRLGKTVLRAGLASNLVIDSSGRSGQLFLRLQAQFFRQCRDMQLQFVFGTVTRPEVFELQVRTGYEKAGDLPVLARPYRLLPVARNYFKGALGRHVLGPLMSLANPLLRMKWIRAPRGISIREVSQFDARLDALTARVLSAYAIAAVRSTDILNWRFRPVANRAYRILLAEKDGEALGYVVLRRMHMAGMDALAMVDLLYDPADPGTGKALLAAVHARAVRERVDLVSIVLNPSSPYTPLLRRLGFLGTGLTLTLVVHKQLARAAGFQPSDFAGWHYTWFDHDFV